MHPQLESTRPDSDQCALNKDGSLKDASEIEWQYDADEAIIPPVPSVTVQAPTNKIENSATFRNGRARNSSRMKEILDAERQSDGEHSHRKSTKKRKRRQPRNAGALTDNSDANFNASSSGTESVLTDGDSDCQEISNVELADSLSTKTIPVGKKRHSSGKKLAPKRRRAALDPYVQSSQSTAPPEILGPVTESKKKIKGKQNPVHLFYEEVSVNRNGNAGEPGDRHYRCYHGDRKTFTISKAMNHSLNGLIGHLKSHFPTLYQLYCYLKLRTDTPPTNEEIEFASGSKVYDATIHSSYLRKFKTKSTDIEEAFMRQKAKAMEPWNQQQFECLLIEWIVACDQPFDEVEKPEFIALMEYHRNPSTFSLPKKDGVRRRIMTLGEDTVSDTKSMFAELRGKISLSLDAWSSGNGYAFLAIVAHYIKNNGQYEELLIDFREIMGAHSGENMAALVWSTLECYGITAKIMAIMMDNASNNDTMIQSLEAQCKVNGIPFSAINSRMRCMPHTIHLAALKLLEGIGIISSDDSLRAQNIGFTYQDEVSMHIDRECDMDVSKEDCEEDEDGDVPSKDVQSAIHKLRKIVRSVRSSPQRRQHWYQEIAKFNKNLLQSHPTLSSLMLILDVKTRWSSTHQMFRRALDYRPIIDSYVHLHNDLWPNLLSADDWHSIELVTGWLKSFRLATTQMSKTQTPMLSSIQAIFRGLEEDIQSIIRSLPKSTSPCLLKGLTDAHRKLSDYFHTFDESPFYIWSSLLDPRISYDALKDDFHDDPQLSAELESAKLNLRRYFDENYPPISVSSSSPQPLSAASSQSSVSSQSSLASPQKSFTARFQRKRAPADELTEFWNLQQEDFDACDPLEWWQGRRAQFPRLHCLARDLLSIPGSAVAVERIFSSGRDTISLRRASLKPETIRCLMLVKRKLIVSREKIISKLQ